MPSKLEIFVNIAITTLIMTASNFSTIGNHIQSIANSFDGGGIMEMEQRQANCDSQPQPDPNFARNRMTP
ncbi:hypothetical protein [Oscillatoria acuminata]|uniref:Uncharacterized protein n=1 Tax=Oscillatoria acuminata PCC 6304 TaxID=56110 RepID=K9TNV1_9CYAN|nr:hypothetical protein [Oscillatoria acuminata]AFY83801.1 hypothetical protein Oscil6304_4275 [Oscillatoria acuminata PCC 6304]